MVINVNDFDYNLLTFKELQKEKNKYKKRPTYSTSIGAFDIETTNLEDIQQSIMYIWQFQLDDKYTIIGRTWDEFKILIDNLNNKLDNLTLVVYVHNLSFEWQWLKSILPIDKVFALDDRKVLYFISNNIEFRCSYLHSNMTLEKYVKKMNARHQKIKGFDYLKLRYSWTELNEKELEYCINDVRALVEAIVNEMEKDGDDLYTIPYTSTGYVRREFKKVMKKYQKQVRAMLPSLEVFEGLRACFRGGNTHAHRGNAGRILRNVYSYDISSSYPGVLLTEEYPTRFTRQKPKNLWLALKHNRACLIHIRLVDVRLIDNNFGCPYLAIGKCNNIINAEEDNGRILSCDSLTTWINEIDLKILLMEYNFEYEVMELFTAPKKKLPKEFRDLLFEMYKKKTLLKGSGDDYAYNKYKNMINSVYGMTVQNPCKVNYIYKDGMLVVNEEENLEELIEHYHKVGWLPYQVGVWVTSYARLKLEEGIHAIPYTDFVYADTDSIKFVGNHGSKIEELNKIYQDDDLCALDMNGKKHYIGIYEYEGKYSSFSTLGAKKYCYIQDGKLHVTISGVNKKEGARELQAIKNFKEGFTFHKAGGKMALYNDNPSPSRINIEGHDVDIISNIALFDSTYTLGITADYERLLSILNNVDISYYLHYTR